MGDIIDETLVKKIENGELKNENLMRGKVMGGAFNLIRSNDLIWNYVCKQLPERKKPAPFDVLYLEWRQHQPSWLTCMAITCATCFYENKLSRKNALRICDTPVDIGRLNYQFLLLVPAKTIFHRPLPHSLQPNLLAAL